MQLPVRGEQCVPSRIHEFYKRFQTRRLDLLPKPGAFFPQCADKSGIFLRVFGKYFGDGSKRNAGSFGDFTDRVPLFTQHP